MSTPLTPFRLTAPPVASASTMDFSVELTQILGFAGDAATAIRMRRPQGSSVPSALSVPHDAQREALELRYLVDTLQHFSALTTALDAAVPAQIITCCNDLLRVFAPAFTAQADTASPLAPLSYERWCRIHHLSHVRLALEKIKATAADAMSVRHTSQSDGVSPVDTEISEYSDLILNLLQQLEHCATVKTKPAVAAALGPFLVDAKRQFQRYAAPPVIASANLQINHPSLCLNSVVLVAKDVISTVGVFEADEGIMLLLAPEFVTKYCELLLTTVPEPPPEVIASMTSPLGRQAVDIVREARRTLLTFHAKAQGTCPR